MLAAIDAGSTCVGADFSPRCGPAGRRYPRSPRRRRRAAVCRRTWHLTVLPTIQEESNGNSAAMSLDSIPSSMSSASRPSSLGVDKRTHHVQLAVSPIVGCPMATAYHTSVLLDGVEFSFNMIEGIVTASGPLSHKLWQPDGRLHDLGRSLRSGNELIATLSHKFEPGTYDLLRKNCNHFTDCALFFLLGRRLSAEYCVLERFGSSIPALVESVSGGRYTPNDLAKDFTVEALIRDLATRSPGNQASTGGSNDYSPTAAKWVLCEAVEALPGTLAALLGRCCTEVPPSPSKPKLVENRIGCRKSKHLESVDDGGQNATHCRMRRCYAV